MALSKKQQWGEMGPPPKRQTKHKGPLFEYAIKVGDKWVSRFTSPPSTTKLDKLWEKSEGIRVAQCLKAILGDTPYKWPNTEDSCRYTARNIPGGKVVEFTWVKRWRLK